MLHLVHHHHIHLEHHSMMNLYYHWMKQIHHDNNDDDDDDVCFLYHHRWVNLEELKLKKTEREKDGNEPLDRPSIFISSSSLDPGSP